MSDSVDMTKIERSLGTYQALVAGGLAFMAVFAVTVMALMFWQIYRVGEQSERIKTIALTTHSSLCALKEARVVEVKKNRAFLKENPHGLTDRFGNVVVSAALIQDDIDAQQDTIDALTTGGLTCP